MKQSVLVFVIALSAASLCTAEPSTLDPVQRKYKPKLDSAKRQYLATVVSMKRQMLRDYEQLLSRAMQQKNLELANKYQSKIGSLKGGDKDAGQGREVLNFSVGVPVTHEAQAKDNRPNNIFPTAWTGTAEQHTIEFHADGKGTLLVGGGPTKYEIAYRQTSKSTVEVTVGPVWIQGIWKFDRRGKFVNHIKTGDWQKKKKGK